MLKGIQVIYEDEHFLFLSKPAGILSQKAKPADCSLNEWMIGYLLEKNPSLAEELITFLYMQPARPQHQRNRSMREVVGRITVSEPIY